MRCAYSERPYSSWLVPYWPHTQRRKHSNHQAWAARCKVQANRWLTHHKRKCKQIDGSYHIKKKSRQTDGSHNTKIVQANRWLIPHHKKKSRQTDGSHNTKKWEHQRGGVQPWPWLRTDGDGQNENGLMECWQTDHDHPTWARWEWESPCLVLR